MEQRLSVPEWQIFLSDSADERHSQQELWEARECWLARSLKQPASYLWHFPYLPAKLILPHTLRNMLLSQTAETSELPILPKMIPGICGACLNWRKILGGHWGEYRCVVLSQL